MPLVINTDSHSYTHLDKRRFGVGVARRAWCGPKDILNTMSREDFLEYIRAPKPGRIAIFDRRRNSVASV